MSDELDELYEQLILDHNAHPHNYGALGAPTHRAQGYNPLCGDEVEIFLQLEGEVIVKISFTGQGCAISKSSASLMTEVLLGKTRQQAQVLFSQFHGVLTKEDVSEGCLENLGKAMALAKVKRFPMRVKCATLAWHTLRAALLKEVEPVTTE